MLAFSVFDSCFTMYLHGVRNFKSVNAVKDDWRQVAGVAGGKAGHLHALMCGTIRVHNPSLCRSSFTEAATPDQRAYHDSIASQNKIDRYGLSTAACLSSRLLAK